MKKEVKRRERERERERGVWCCDDGSNPIQTIIANLGDGLAHHHHFFSFISLQAPIATRKKIESHNCPAYTHNYYFVTKLPLTHHHSYDAIPIIIQNQNIKSLPLTGRLPCLHMNDCCVRWEKAMCVRLSLLFFFPPFFLSFLPFAFAFSVFSFCSIYYEASLCSLCPSLHNTISLFLF